MAKNYVIDFKNLRLVERFTLAEFYASENTQLPEEMQGSWWANQYIQELAVMHPNGLSYILIRDFKHNEPKIRDSKYAHNIKVGENYEFHEPIFHKDSSAAQINFNYDEEEKIYGSPVAQLMKCNNKLIKYQINDLFEDFAKSLKTPTTPKEIQARKNEVWELFEKEM